jgi:hypothetical protein
MKLGEPLASSFELIDGPNPPSGSGGHREREDSTPAGSIKGLMSPTNAKHFCPMRNNMTVTAAEGGLSQT